MSKKGIVCEIKREYCVFLTPDGQFMRGIPLEATVQVGDEAEFNEFTVIAKKPSPLKRAVFPIIAAAAVFMLLFATILHPSQSVHAYVQVEGLETVEFGVDESGQIVEVRPLSGGTIRIKTDSYKGKPVDSVIEDLLTSKAELQEPVSITTVFTKKAGDGNKQSIEQAISDVKNKFNEKEITVYRATEKERNEANEKGVAIQQLLNPKKIDQNRSQKNNNSNPGVKAGHKKYEAEQKSPSPKKPDNENNNQRERTNQGRHQEKQQPNGKNGNSNTQSDVNEKKPSNQSPKTQNQKNEDRKENKKESNGKGKDNHSHQNGNGEEKGNHKGNGQGKDQGKGQGQGNNKDKDKNDEDKGNDN